MALDGECKVIMRYWLPLLARGAKQPVSSVKILVIGITVMSSPDAVAEAGKGRAVGIGTVCFVDQMCWRSCAI